MNEINKILNDESHNDKQLIKELSVYVKNHRDRNLPINKKFFTDVINITLRNSEVEFNDVIFDDDLEYNFDAMWFDDDLMFIYKITKIINREKFYRKNWFAPIALKVDRRVCAYYVIISIAIHEITHARQDYISRYLNNEIYDSCNNFIENYYEKYLKYHDEVLIERYANLRGNIIAYKVLSYIYPLKFITPFRDIILTYLEGGYKINNQLISINKDPIITSPIDNDNCIMEENSCDKINIEINKNMTFYDRLYLGLPISEEEYIKLITINEDIFEYILSNNDQSDIKRLINRK